ncbi:hypothetical protein [Brevundimonas sp.]|uniref:hypothetical protein n=1 Tax=Brevundimonas sp. TaxID=1871086 RepID=UPI002D393B8D|nr:hypothetical protein [Brevundimonas sp.]HYD26935.1 hypothetical protein [Brevundimonas sp.]
MPETLRFSAAPEAPELVPGKVWHEILTALVGDDRARMSYRDLRNMTGQGEDLSNRARHKRMWVAISPMLDAGWIAASRGEVRILPAGRRELDACNRRAALAQAGEAA